MIVIIQPSPLTLDSVSAISSIGGGLWERRKMTALSKLNLAMIDVLVYNMLVMTYGL